MLELLPDVPDSIWYAFLQPANGATFFHSPGWVRTIARLVSRFRAQVVYGEVAGQRVLWPVIIAGQPWPFRASWIALPWLCPGAPLADPPPLRGAAAEALAALVRSRRPCAATIVWPAATVPPDCCLPGFARRQCVTHVLELNAPFATLFDRCFEGRLRTAVRKAERSGVQVQNDAEPQAIEGYWQLVVGDLARRRHDPLTRALLEELVRQPGARLWTAWLGGRMVAGMVVLTGPAEAFWWHGAVDPQARAEQPGALLLSSAIAGAVADGVPRFNLGASTRLPGVAAFKASCGAVEMPYWIDRSTYGTRGALYRLVSRASAGVR